MSKNLGLKHENKYFAALSWSKFMFEILDAFKSNGWSLFTLHYQRIRALHWVVYSDGVGSTFISRKKLTPFKKKVI